MRSARRWISSIAAGLSVMFLAVLINAGPMRAEQALAATLRSAAAAAPASWYNQSWALRVPISVDNTQGNVALSNYQVKISLPSTFDFAKTQSNGNDIRFTSSDGVALLNYWIQSYNPAAQTGIIWVNVPALPAGAVTTIYMYYDNPNAAAASSGSGTFPFFSDFSDPAWTSLPAMPFNAADESASFVNGNFYIIGGYNNTATNPLASNYRFNPATGTYTAMASMPTARWGIISGAIGNKIYVFGGNINSSSGSAANQSYNPATNTWAKNANLPAAIAHQGITGCTDGTSMYLFYNSLTYRYNPATNTYTQLASMPDPMLSWASCSYVNGNIYVIGGYSNGTQSFTQIYSIAGNSWSVGAAMPFALYGAVREDPVIGNNIYILQGQRADGEFSADSYIYNTATNTWSEGSLGPHAADGVAGGVYNGQIYTFGGRQDWTGPYGLNYATTYNPADDSGSPWTQVTGGFEMSGGSLQRMVPPNGTDNNGPIAQIRSRSYQTSGNFVMDAQSDQSSSGGSWNSIGINASAGTYNDDLTGYQVPYNDYGTAPTQTDIERENGASFSILASHSPAAVGSQQFEVTSTSSTISLSANGSPELSTNDTTYRNGYLDMETGDSDGSTWNFVFTRQYAANTPSSTVGSEQSGSGSSGNTVTVANPGSQTGTVGIAASLQISASDSASGQTLTYSASGLPAGLSINSSSGLISGTPTTAGTSSVTVTATDTTGASGSATFTWTISGAFTCPCSAWGPSAAPASSATTNTTAYELGTRFYSTVSGTVTALRFYKEPGMASTHTGNLWDSNGNLLATVTFTNESGSGWQQASLSSPVAITANTPYIVSYVINGGPFGYTQSQFATQGAGSDPIHLYQDGVAGPNGVFNTGGPGFPTGTWSSTNYWSDIVFMPT